MNGKESRNIFFMNINQNILRRAFNLVIEIFKPEMPYCCLRILSKCKYIIFLVQTGNTCPDGPTEEEIVKR